MAEEMRYIIITLVCPQVLTLTSWREIVLDTEVIDLKRSFRSTRSLKRLRDPEMATKTIM